MLCARCNDELDPGDHNCCEACDLQDQLRARIAGLDKGNNELGALANRYHLELTRYRNALERITLTEPIGEVAYRIAREALNPTGDELLRENGRTNQATREAEDRCVNAILSSNQFFLGGIEPEMREAVVRRALNL
jgi:hypothetical protein